MAALFIISFLLFTALGAVCGVFKKFTKTSIGGVTVILAFAFERAIGGAIKKDKGSYGIAIIILSVCLLMLFFAGLTVFKKIMTKKVEERKKFSHYKNLDAIEEREAYILDAVDKNDMKAYKKELKALKKIKDKAGVWGLLDTIFGGVAGGFNALLITSCVIMGWLMFVDISGIHGLVTAFEKSLNSGAWNNFASKIVLDVTLLGVLYLCVVAGYKSGLSNAMCVLVVLGITVGFGAGAWVIASKKCPDLVDSLQGKLGFLDGSDLGKTVAQIIIAAIIFLMSLIVVILIAIFLPKLVEKLRTNKIYKSVDGVIGAIIVSVLVFAVLMVVGSLAYSTFNGYGFIQTFTHYTDKAFFGSGLFDKNPLNPVFEGLINI